ncbi:MAG: two-component system, OmpR family, phosphate regulon sensor histidine kinase PhoR [Desulfovibrionales bacterium]|nr:two-component system, OmpR family, phosphate regulon sensor histidine kinase PhoR [Desulfovibrionales bacterium]
MTNLSLRTKLLLSFWIIIALCSLLPGFYVLHSLPPETTGGAPLRHELIFLLAVCFGASIIFAVMLTRGLLRSISCITESARIIGDGNLTRRISPPPNNELKQVAEAINWMAENLHQQIQTVNRQNETLEAVLDAMWDGVLILDRSGKVLKINRSMREIQPNIETMLGRKPLEAIHSPEFQSVCQEVLTLDEKHSKSLTIDLRERLFEVNVVRATRTPDLGAVAVFHDISEQRKLEKMRRDFVANVSHELRTPLTSVKGYTETLLADEPPPPEMARNFLGVILRNANHMAKMVDDLLSLSRLEAASDPTKKPIRPDGALATAWEACSSLADSKNVRLERKFPERDVQVMANPDQLVRIFRNLLENALKFGPRDSSITVLAEVVDDKARFTILDKGPGIPKKDQPRVFERFYSVQKYRSNENGSTGLGLAICRRIVHNHGGDIWLESPPKTPHESGGSSGTAFLFTMPLAT